MSTSIRTSADIERRAGVRRSNSDSQQSLLSASHVARTHDASIASSVDAHVDSAHRAAAQWIPLPLRWYFICFLTTLSFVLGLLIMPLYWYSHKHNGLSSEALATFGWKFIPTFIAVLYTQLVTMLLDAVKREEPFARMARAESPEAKYTVLEKSRPWWTTLFHGFHKTKNGGKRSWLVILTSGVFIIAILGLSPISAALLSTQDVQGSRSIPMTRLSFNDQSALTIKVERETYLRTTGAVLQNYSTSPWVDDDFFVLPFWPQGVGGSPWTHRSSDPQVWEAETTVFHTDLKCEKAELKSADYYLRHARDKEFKTTKYHLASVLLQSRNECQYNITLNDTGMTLKRAWTSWTDFNHITLSQTYTADAHIIQSSQCHADEAIIISSTPWIEGSGNITRISPNISIGAYFCTSTHTMAPLVVRASLTGSNMVIDFDKNEFDHKRETISDTNVNHTSLHTALTAPDWYSYISQASITNSSAPPFGGMSSLLATKYAFNMTKMMNDSKLPDVAAKMRRRFFSEVLRKSFNEPENAKQENIHGTLYTMERRVLVNVEVASLLCALFLLSFFCLIAIAWLWRTGSNQLKLSHDPSTVLGMMALLDSRTPVLPRFSSFEQSSRKILKANLKKEVFTISSGTLKTAHQASQEQATKEATASHGKIKILRIRTLIGLAVYLMLIVCTISVLYSFAQRSDLHQALFTYRANLKVLGSLGSFSPFAIIPTLFAVVVTLWWDTIDSTCRSLQPFLAMSHEPRRISAGVGLSYASSFWIWTSIKAAKNRHWLLSLVTLGTILVQALTIAMSAVFEQGNGIVFQYVDLDRTLELRRDPLVRQVESSVSTKKPDTGGWYNTNVKNALEQVFLGLETDWLYTAMIQASFQGHEPAWSKDGWSFVPLDLAHLRESPNNTTEKRGTTPHIGSSMNVTVQTPAIRARIECSFMDKLSNNSAWLRLIDQNLPVNRTELPTDRNVFLPEPSMPQYHTVMTPQATYPQCCANETGRTDIGRSKSPVTIGYWTSNYPFNDKVPRNSATGTTGNFTIKWLRGDAGFANLFYPQPEAPWLYFTEQPQVQALNCIPIIEAAEAEVTVDRLFGKVQTYKVLQPPVAEDVAWADAFLFRNLSSVSHMSNTTNSKSFELPMTTSYGNLFLYSLLRAASLINLGGSGAADMRGIKLDRLEDKVFNMRDNKTGLNVDFMSYATLMQVDHDPTRLLDAEVLLNESQKIFSTFFQHFASSTFPLDEGSWAYQRIGSRLQVGPPMVGEGPQYLPNGHLAPNFRDFARQDPNNRTTTATLSIRVEVLRMNVIAFWVASGILTWLIVTVIIFAALQRRYVGGMVRNVECIADVMVLIAGSQRLLELVEEKGIDGLIKEDNIYTRLGWFRDTKGNMRWGIEVVENDDMEMRVVSWNMDTTYRSVPGFSQDTR